MNSGVGDLLPGLALLGLVAAAAQLLGTRIPLLSPLVLAIGIGAIVANGVGLPGWAEAGVGRHSLLLETAIVLLGAELSVAALVAAGPGLAVLVVAVVAFGLGLVTVLSRVADLNERIGSLLAAGASICGVSAIAAVAPVCDADEAQVAHAAATVLLFDAVTLVAFPVAGTLLGADPRVYGVWVGLSMFSTGPVAAAGFAHSTTAGEWATVTKLARNALIGVVAVWYSVRYAGRADGGAERSLGRTWADFPKFLVGFAALVALTSAGAIPAPAVDAIARTSDALFLLAFAGLGVELRLDRMRDAGLAPVAVLGVALLVVSGLTYLVVTLLF
jgi:uncharacterized integral membrane protein (TIGR00698 family)